MIPLRITDLQQSTKWPKHIIIHHTAEQFDQAGLNVDNASLQASKLEKILYTQEKKYKFTNYHFIIEKVKDDYQIMVSQPLLTKSIWPDLDPDFYYSVHVGLMGDYDIKAPQNRLYKVLAFKLLAPLTRLFYIKEENILMHKSISFDPDITCPGINFDMTVLKSYYRAIRKRTPIVRKW